MRATIRQYLEAIAWLAGTIVRVSGRQLGAFGLATVLMGVLRIMQFLVMVLPLKVVLLASQEGVPSYAPFIADDLKTEWIAGLAIGTIVAYVLVQFLDSAATRLCETAGTRLMADAAALNVVPNQRDQARNIFADLASVLADSLFWLAGMVLYLIIAPVTFAAYLGMVVASFMLGTLFAVAKDRWGLGQAHRFIAERTDHYVSTNSTIIFFVCFLVILYPYLTGLPVNVLIGLVSIMLLRRTLSALSDAVRGSVKLIRRRHLVDTLMFKNRQLIPQPRRDHVLLTKYFGPTRRIALARRMLAEVGIEKHVAAVSWIDPTVPGLLVFLVRCSDETHYQLLVYPPQKSHDADNETILFSILSRSALGAPRLLHEIEYEGCTCRLLEAGLGRPATVQRWKQVRADIVVRQAGLEPGNELRDLYRSTHMLVHEKLTEDFIKQIKIAIRNKEDRVAVQSFLGHITQTRSRLARLPLFVSVRQFTASHTMDRDDKLPMMVYWGQWSLAPLGSGIMATLSAGETEDVLARLRLKRSDIIEDISSADLRLAAQIHALTNFIERGSYAAALEIILAVENNTMIETVDEPEEAEIDADSMENTTAPAPAE